MARLIDALEQVFLPNGLLDFYESGGSTLRKTTYADFEETIENSNPLVLNGDGRVPNVFGTGKYRVVLRTAGGAQILQRDPVGGNESISFGSEYISTQIYSVNDVVRDDTRYWVSKVSGNVGNKPSLDSGSNWFDFLEVVKNIQEQGILTYLADVNYLATVSYAVGSDGALYRSMLANGPNTTVVNPVGDLTSTWVKFYSASITGSATFTNSSNSIALPGFGAITGIEVGDVYTIAGTASNNGEFTVEVITDANNVIVNQAHANGTTKKSLSDENVTATVTLLSKWYNASFGLGQGWANVLANRTSGLTETNNTNRTIESSMSASRGDAFYIQARVDGKIVKTNRHVGVINNTSENGMTISKDSSYSLTLEAGTIDYWQEMR
jgi:hypothetical protein